MTTTSTSTSRKQGLPPLVPPWLGLTRRPLPVNLGTGLLAHLAFTFLLQIELQRPHSFLVLANWDPTTIPQ
jgi:hypothetical protein